MALSLFSRRRSDDPFDSFFSGDQLLPFPSFSSALMRFPDHPNFARDVAAIANTQVDWKELSDSHEFKVNLPGLTKDEVKVQVEDGGILQISGERRKEETSATDRWHRVERAHGSFLRRFRLPDNAKVEEMRAAMENGVLTVTVPKAAALESKASAQAIDITS